MSESGWEALRVTFAWPRMKMWKGKRGGKFVPTLSLFLTLKWSICKSSSTFPTFFISRAVFCTLLTRVYSRSSLSLYSGSPLREWSREGGLWEMITPPRLSSLFLQIVQGHIVPSRGSLSLLNKRSLETSQRFIVPNCSMRELYVSYKFLVQITDIHDDCPICHRFFPVCSCTCAHSNQEGLHVRFVKQRDRSQLLPGQ